MEQKTGGLRPNRSRDPLWITAQRKSLATLARGYGLYYFNPFEKQAFLGFKIIKPCCCRNKAFSL